MIRPNLRYSVGGVAQLWHGICIRRKNISLRLCTEIYTCTYLSTYVYVVDA